jgi:hypothetical protein
MLRKILTLCVVLFCAVGFVAAGNVEIARASEWNETYGGSNDEWGQCAQQTFDGGYIMVGTRNSGPTGGADIYLVKTDSSGDTLWTKTFVRKGEDGGECVQQTADSGYIIVGTISGNNGDLYLIKTDSSGDTVWTRRYGGAQPENGHFVRQTFDGGYIAAGRTYSFGPGTPSYNNVYLVRTDSNGDSVWAVAYGKDRMDGAYCVVQTSDSGFVATGWTCMSQIRCYDVYLIKVDSDGDSLWARNYGHPDSIIFDDWGEWVEETYDGGLIITGLNSSYSYDDYDVWLIRTDADGDTAWTRTFGGSAADGGYSVKQCSDTGYVVAGTAGSGIGPGGNDVFLIKTDQSGSTEWIRAFGGASADEGRAVDQTSNGNYLVGGFTNSFGAGGNDFYLAYRETPDYVCGDANGDEGISAGDVIYLTNYLYRGGPAPDPLDSGDANCSGTVDVGDMTYLSNYLFSNGPEPCCP